MTTTKNNRRLSWVPRYALNAPTLTEDLIAALELAGLRVIWRGAYRPRPWAFELEDVGPAF